jgi:hypothetical protein
VKFKGQFVSSFCSFSVLFGTLSRGYQTDNLRLRHLAFLFSCFVWHTFRLLLSLDFPFSSDWAPGCRLSTKVYLLVSSTLSVMSIHTEPYDVPPHLFLRTLSAVVVCSATLWHFFTGLAFLPAPWITQSHLNSASVRNPIFSARPIEAVLRDLVRHCALLRPKPPSFGGSGTYCKRNPMAFVVT